VRPNRTSHLTPGPGRTSAPALVRSRALERVAREIVACDACPRLRRHCRAVAEEKRRAFRDQEYWGRPVPGFGDPGARILLVGLAPAAHGGNRTGRAFTGDRSGDFLYAALHRAGLATQPTSVTRGDGLELIDVYIAAAARCAPPGNRPTPEELRRCRPFLVAELAALTRLRVVVALGGIGFDAALDVLGAPRPRPRFGHGSVARPGPGKPALVGCYHPSQQNTFTGRLTASMMDAVFAEARRLAQGP
jgi:uracil-DNA glycosylase family 4